MHKAQGTEAKHSHILLSTPFAYGQLLCSLTRSREFPSLQWYGDAGDRPTEESDFLDWIASHSLAIEHWKQIRNTRGKKRKVTERNDDDDDDNEEEEEEEEDNDDNDAFKLATRYDEDE